MTRKQRDAHKVRQLLGEAQYVITCGISLWMYGIIFALIARSQNEAFAMICVAFLGIMFGSIGFLQYKLYEWEKEEYESKYGDI